MILIFLSLRIYHKNLKVEEMAKAEEKVIKVYTDKLITWANANPKLHYLE